MDLALSQHISVTKVPALNDETVRILSIEGQAVLVGFDQQCGVLATGL